MHTRPVHLPADRDELLAFFDEAGASLSENKHAFLALQDGRPGAGVVAETDRGVVGYVGLAPARHGEWAMELVAGPAATEPLVEEALGVARRKGARRLRWWVYVASEEDRPLLYGFRPERELLVMGRGLPAGARPTWREFSVRGFRPGEDEEQWLEVNNAAFADHPENGDVTLADLKRRMEMEWFDPAGLRTAWQGDRLAGFCWTKVHEGGDGEIYIIGVHPDFQGTGLGSALAEEGMHHLTTRGCPRVFLYTEGDNQAAIGMYRQLGFDVERTHRSYVRAVPG